MNISRIWKHRSYKNPFKSLQAKFKEEIKLTRLLVNNHTSLKKGIITSLIRLQSRCM